MPAKKKRKRAPSNKPAPISLTPEQHHELVRYRGSPMEVLTRRTGLDEATIRAYAAQRGMSLELHPNSPHHPDFVPKPETVHWGRRRRR